MLAFEKDVRKRTQARMTDLHRDSQKADLVSGVHKKYQPLDDAGQRYPDERKPVHLLINDAIQGFSDAWQEETELVGRKEAANTEARADVVLPNGRVLAEAVPVGYLLFLEKQLQHVRTFVEKLAELPVGENWTWNPDDALYHSDDKVTQRTEKIPEVVQMTPTTKEHPGTAQLMARDKVVGLWTTVLYSGATTRARKRVMLDHIAEISDAVKAAREKANEVVAPPPTNLAERIMEYVLGV